MPLRAAIISYDASGAPTLLADPRTSASEQQRQFAAIKTGLVPAPDDAARIEFVVWGSEAVERWIAPVVATPAEPKTEITTSKKKDKSK